MIVLAVVLIQKSSGSVVQRLSSADQIASDEFQRWLRYMNREKHEIYVSMNALQSGARGRTKADVDEVRHVYLDFDVKGDEAVQALKGRDDLPTPNHLIESSPGKWQVVWRVEGFDPTRLKPSCGAWSRSSELIQLRRTHLGSPGAWLLQPQVLETTFRSVQNLTDEVYDPSRFPEYPDDGRSTRMAHVGGIEHPSTAGEDHAIGT